jgi:hypothetical protein
MPLGASHSVRPIQRSNIKTSAAPPAWGLFPCWKSFFRLRFLLRYGFVVASVLRLRLIVHGLYFALF